MPTPHLSNRPRGTKNRKFLCENDIIARRPRHDKKTPKHNILDNKSKNVRFLRVQFQKIGFCKVHAQNVILNRLGRHEIVPITVCDITSRKLKKLPLTLEVSGFPAHRWLRNRATSFTMKINHCGLFGKMSWNFLYQNNQCKHNGQIKTITFIIHNFHNLFVRWKISIVCYH